MKTLKVRVTPNINIAIDDLLNHLSTVVQKATSELRKAR